MKVSWHNAIVFSTLVGLSSSPSFAQSPLQGFFGIGAAITDGGPNLYVSGGTEKMLSETISIGADAGATFDPHQYAFSTFVGAQRAGWNLGGGVNYWLRQRFGIRFDVRAVLLFHEDGGGMAMTTAGIVFR